MRTKQITAEGSILKPIVCYALTDSFLRRIGLNLADGNHWQIISLINWTLNHYNILTINALTNYNYRLDQCPISYRTKVI
jgi:hypothetical protein